MYRFYVRLKQKNNMQMNTHDGIGVDLGIKDFATCSHHKTFQNINKTQKVKKLKRD